MDNLSAYLSNARSCKTLIIEDLRNVIHCIAAKASDEYCSISEKQQTITDTKSSHDASEQLKLQTGEHNLAFFGLKEIMTSTTQRTDPGTKITGEFSTRGHIFPPNV